MRVIRLTIPIDLEKYDGNRVTHLSIYLLGDNKRFSSLVEYVKSNVNFHNVQRFICAASVRWIR